MDDTEAPRPLYDTGLKIRKEVIGAAYVEKSLANADAFSRPLQDMVTEYCWGNIWGRPGLDRKTRSLLNIAMLSALNRGHELKLHVRGAGAPPRPPEGRGAAYPGGPAEPEAP